MVTELSVVILSLLTALNSNSIQIPNFAPLKIAGWILKIKRLLLVH